MVIQLIKVAHVKPLDGFGYPKPKLRPYPNSSLITCALKKHDFSTFPALKNRTVRKETPDSRILKVRALDEPLMPRPRGWPTVKGFAKVACCKRSHGALQTQVGYSRIVPSPVTSRALPTLSGR